MSTSAEHTAALIKNSGQVTLHAVNGLLDGLSSTISSNETGDPGIDEPLGLIRKELDTIGITQGEEEGKIKDMLQSVLDREVVAHIHKEIEKMVNERIDEIVAQLVESCLDEYVPRSLRERADKDRTELVAVQIELHNAEARRQNAAIKNRKHLREQIVHILNKDAAKSDPFPESVDEILALSDKNLTKLVGFYGRAEPGKKSIIDNTNWFLECCGVSYRHTHS